MPTYGFAFAIGVSRNIDHIGAFRGRLELPDYLFFAGDDLVRRIEVVVEVDANALLWKVLYMPDRGDNLEPGTEVLIDRLRL